LVKKILIVYATAGIGHKKASLAVKAAFDEMAPQDTQASIIDALDYTNAFFKWSYLKAYLLMVNRMPTFWGLAYYMTDNRYVNILISFVRRVNNWINSRRLERYIAESRPDVIVSTHFFASEVVSDLKKRGLCKSRLVTVVTDYRLHSWWVADHTDMYVVGGEDARRDLLGWDVPDEKIRALGIPVEPVFSKRLDAMAILEKSGLREDKFTILVVGGGFGVGPIEDIIKISGNISEKVQIIAVCGHNEDLVRRLEALKPGLKADLKILGFVNNVYEYMEVAEVLISKSGGITVSESLAKELPLIVIAPIIGQETRNCDFLINHRAALRLGGVGELRGLLEYLHSHPEKLQELTEAIRLIKKPNACYDIAKLALDMA
jgi:processive 1,2-diacylglycerol beta-glucosyltransferase